MLLCCLIHLICRHRVILNPFSITSGIEDFWYAPSFAHPYTLLRARASQGVFQESLSTSAMPASRDIAFYQHEFDLCWSRNTSSKFPIRKVTPCVKSFLTPCSINLAGLRSSADLFNPSQPCQRTMLLFPSKSVLM